MLGDVARTEEADGPPAQGVVAGGVLAPEVIALACHERGKSRPNASIAARRNSAMTGLQTPRPLAMGMGASISSGKSRWLIPWLVICTSLS